MRYSLFRLCIYTPSESLDDPFCYQFTRIKSTIFCFCKNSPFSIATKFLADWVGINQEAVIPVHPNHERTRKTSIYANFYPFISTQILPEAYYYFFLSFNGKYTILTRLPFFSQIEVMPGQTFFFQKNLFCF